MSLTTPKLFSEVADSVTGNGYSNCVSLLREPDAANPHVRFDERGVETGHGELLGHRQPKGPATRKATPNLPRHSSTLRAPCKGGDLQQVQFLPGNCRSSR